MIKQYQGIGKAGAISRSGQLAIDTRAAICNDGKIYAGAFVQLAGDFNDNDAISVNLATGEAISKHIIGVALFEYVGTCNNTNGIINYPKGHAFNVITHGNVFIETKTQAKTGDYVFLKNDNGELAFDTTKEKADYIFTGWRVSKSAENVVNNNNLIEISTNL